MKRISFKTWYGNFENIKNIPYQNLRDKDTFIDETTKNVYVYQKGKGWTPEQLKNEFFYSPFFQKEFNLNDTIYNQLLSMLDKYDDTITILDNNNVSVELNSFECKILLNEIFSIE
jgi:hypothetical protein